MTKKFKQVCKCTKCGNEAEMMVSCSLKEVETAERKKTEHRHDGEPGKTRVKGTGVCTNCGNEAEMWVDL